MIRAPLHSWRPGGLDRFLAMLLLCLAPAMPVAIAATADGVAPTEAGKPFATVWRLRGEVTASGRSGGRALREGDVVAVGERVHTGNLAEAVLKTADAGIVAVRPGSQFLAERFVAEGRSSDSSTLRLLTGSLRLVTGWIGRLNRNEHKVITPSATIGVRGTDHEPYVLSAELAATTGNREGTYDKVNSGGTTMDVNGQKLDIDAGRVGFVRGPAKPYKTRAMMTLLLPVLLDKVPNFYVPGEFDAEIDRYAQTIDTESQRQLEQKRATGDAAGATRCEPKALAKAWLARLDRAVQRRNADAILALFAPEVAIRATVRARDGEATTLELSREELAQSTVAAVKSLTQYRQRRISIEGSLAEPASLATCDRLAVRSLVIEQGRQSGRPYRFESVEEYVLELRAGQWLAVRSETSQR